MTAPYDLWIQREPRITKAEWRSLIAAYPQLQKPNAAFGAFPGVVEASENLPEFVWYSGAGHLLPTRVAFLQGSLHVEAADPEAREFALELARALGASASEG